jgi:dephospho-CoA kinase
MDQPPVIGKNAVFSVGVSRLTHFLPSKWATTSRCWYQPVRLASGLVPRPPQSQGECALATQDVRCAVIAIGLTGGIGSGKSRVAAMLARRSALVIDSDDLAREALEPGSPGWAKVVERFGPGIVLPDGSCDRALLAGVVFADPDARGDLEAIVHPQVRAEIRDRLASCANADVVVVEVPLLVESASPYDYGFAGVVVVDAPFDVVLQRLVEGRHMELSDARARIASQASRSERNQIAHFLIPNAGSIDELESFVDLAWEWIQARKDE